MDTEGVKFVRLEEIEPNLVHPGKFIGMAVSNRMIPLEVFAKKCGISLVISERVLSGEIEPDDDFIDHTQPLFPDAYKAFRSYRDLYRARVAASPRSPV